LAQAEHVHDKTSKEGAAQMIQITYNQCVEDLQELIHRIANTADTLLASAEELARSQEDLSRRANREAANLEEISANLEEIASAVSENAKHADETKDLAQDVRGQLSQSTSIIDEVTGVIQKATKGAQETTQIAKAIQDIAFTTNILSLNASVEAARAGQHGKGFAVIAAEIRRLAQQVSEESKRSEAIIATLLTAMAAGESGMRQITETVHAIEAKALDMSEHVVAIAEATKEQDDGLQQIAQGVNDLEEGLAQNAAMAEEIQATSESLKRHTEDLTAIVQTFHMDDGQASAAPQTTDLTRALRQAIASHHQWRKRLLEAIYQGKAIDPKTAGDAHACGLGKLLEHNPDLKRLPDYPRIQALHEAFHDEARRIAQLIQAGHKKEARQALMGESVYNTRSQELIEALEDARSVLDSHLNPRASQRLAVITNQPKDDWEVF
jgi:uncharacterized phage infection (PIP) family protein YhgE